ncbi:MAG: DJ-1 family glyoxalase III [Victivallales bacterium]
MAGKIAFLLADGFEEIEAITPVDVLRRLEFNVVLAGLKKNVQGSHGIKIEADCLVTDLNESELDAVVLPGGMPGATYLRDCPHVIELVKKMNSRNAVVAAICAAPIALKKAGVIEGKNVTSHPSVKSELTGANYTNNLTEVDGNIITGKGPGAAYEFAARIAVALGKGAKVEDLLGMMFVK